MADKPEDEIACPKCGSTQIYAAKHGSSAWTGRDQILITCLTCEHKFALGRGQQTSGRHNQTETLPENDTLVSSQAARGPFSNVLSLLEAPYATVQFVACRDNGF
jgi:DNA-directed RNA polymerase subunit RPC12/RpoP